MGNRCRRESSLTRWNCSAHPGLSAFASRPLAREDLKTVGNESRFYQRRRDVPLRRSRACARPTDRTHRKINALVTLKIIKSFACRAPRAPFVMERLKKIDERVFGSSRTDNTARITDSLRFADDRRSTLAVRSAASFRCFNRSLLSITIGFMDEQVSRYGELSAWPLSSTCRYDVSAVSLANCIRSICVLSLLL